MELVALSQRGELFLLTLVVCAKRCFSDMSRVGLGCFLKITLLFCWFFFPLPRRPTLRDPPPTPLPFFEPISKPKRRKSDWPWLKNNGNWTKSVWKCEKSVTRRSGRSRNSSLARATPDQSCLSGWNLARREKDVRNVLLNFLILCVWSFHVVRFVGHFLSLLNVCLIIWLYVGSLTLSNFFLALFV